MNGRKLPLFGVDRDNVENLNAGDCARPDNEPNGNVDDGNKFYQADNDKSHIGGSVELRAKLACSVCAPCHPAVGNVGNASGDIQREEHRRERIAEQNGCAAQNSDGCYGVCKVHSVETAANCAHFFSSSSYSFASK